MKKIFFGFFVCLLLILPSLRMSVDMNATGEISPCDFLNGGWLEERDGIKILHLNGSFYEMGYQLGYFLKYEIIRNLRGFGLLDTIQRNKSSKLWNIQKNYVPPEIVDYIQGTADAIGLSFDDVGCIWIWERNCSLHCSSFIADGPATKSNEIIHVYSLDFPVRPSDPITGLCVLGDPVLIVAKPDNGYAFMYPTFAGYVVESGVNEKGISISNTASPCEDENDYGAPIGIRIFESLFHASNIEEAINILNKNKTFGYDVLISDVNKNEGYVLEQTANLSCISKWNDTNESIRPFYQLSHIIRRTNHFINPETAATQRDYYNLKDLRYLLHFRFGPIYEWYRYKAISSGCRKYIGDLDLNNALSLIRNVYLGRYGGVIWYIIKNTGLKKANSWYQWSYSPKTGDMLICYASQDKVASVNPIHHFNFFELLEEEPT
ncbi:MAG: C45 family autoproteolytic acyltransferase/hydrolase [Euryarchaeota archaeon]|nr:C45 family autoproteolytic acyltransferase/hydrolase [Euryarchaeota archaeon]